MTLEIKIKKKGNDDVHQGKMTFSNGESIIIQFSIANSELQKIHQNALLSNTHTANNENMYHGLFEQKKST